MALSDDIQKRLQSLKTQAPQQSNVRAIQQQLQAKTGKAGGPGVAPRASAIGEQVAQGQAVAAQRQQNQQQILQGQQIGTAAAQQQQQTDLAREGMAARGRMAQEQLGAQVAGAASQRQAAGEEFQKRLGAREQAAVDESTFKVDQVKKQLLSDRGIAEDQLFEEFRQGTESLALRKDGAALEQAGFLTSMSNKAYMSELARIGEQRRLTDRNEWQDTSQRLVLGAQLDEQLKQLNWDTIYKSRDRDFEEWMVELDAEKAVELAEAAAEAQKRAAWVGGLSTVGTIVGGIYGGPAGAAAGGAAGAWAGDKMADRTT